MKSLTGEFRDGFLFWWKGWGFLLSHRKLLVVALVPLMIASGAAWSLAWVLWTYLPQWAHALVDWMGLGSWHDWLYYPFLIGGAVLVFFSSLYAIYVMQAFVALPFNSYLAEKTLYQQGKKAEESKVWREWTAHTCKMLMVSLIKSLLLLAVGIILFIFSFIPVLNIAALCGALMILSMDCMDYSLESMGYGLRQRFSYFVRHWGQWAGMSTALGLTMLVPGLTFLIIPGAVVGAAMILVPQNQKVTVP
jgi:CysZ protein